MQGAVTIRRETDAMLINRIANDGAVRPFVDYRETALPLDLSPAVGRPAEVGIIWLRDGDDGLAAFALTGDREWQAHLLFGPNCRGARAVETAREMLAHMRPYADTIWGAIPTRNKRARWFAHRLGFLTVGFDEFEKEGAVEIVARKEVH